MAKAGGRGRRPRKKEHCARKGPANAAAAAAAAESARGTPPASRRAGQRQQQHQQPQQQQQLHGKSARPARRAGWALPPPPPSPGEGRGKLQLPACSARERKRASASDAPPPRRRAAHTCSLELAGRGRRGVGLGEGGVVGGVRGACRESASGPPPPPPPPALRRFLMRARLLKNRASGLKQHPRLAERTGQGGGWLRVLGASDWKAWVGRFRPRVGVTCLNAFPGRGGVPRV